MNGRILKESEWSISLLDHGFLYGAACFETFRTYDGHPFLFDDHWERLKRSLEALQVEWSMTKDECLDALKQLLAQETEQDRYIRLTVTAGEEGIGLSGMPYQAPNVIMYSKALDKNAPVRKKGHFLRTRRNTPEGDFRMKAHHYINNILARQEVKDAHTEGLFLSQGGHVAEGIVSNLFWVKERVVYTPDVQTGALDGVTRQFVLRLCEVLGVKMEVGFYTPEHALSASEAFVTNSVQGIVPLIGMGDNEMDVGESTITQQLQKEYQEYTDHLMGRNEIGL